LKIQNSKGIAYLSLYNEIIKRGSTSVRPRRAF
jgi:hypothetical protein